MSTLFTGTCQQLQRWLQHTRRKCQAADLLRVPLLLLRLHVAFFRWEQEDPAHELLRACYMHISKLSLLNEQLGFKAGYEKGGECRGVS